MLDREFLFHQNFFYRIVADNRAQHLHGQLCRHRRIGGKLDRSGFAPLADRNQRLQHHLAAQQGSFFPDLRRAGGNKIRGTEIEFCASNCLLLLSNKRPTLSFPL